MKGFTFALTALTMGLCLGSPKAHATYFADIVGSDNGNTSFCLCMEPNGDNGDIRGLDTVHYDGGSHTWSSVSNACGYAFSAVPGSGTFTADFTGLNDCICVFGSRNVGVDLFTNCPQTISGTSCVSGTFFLAPQLSCFNLGHFESVRSCWDISAGPAKYTALLTDPGQVTFFLNQAPNAAGAPEIDSSSAVAPLALMLGVGFLAADRRRRAA